MRTGEATAALGNGVAMFTRLKKSVMGRATEPAPGQEVSAMDAQTVLKRFA